MKILIEVNSLAELVAVGAVIRGDVIDDATLTKIQALSLAARTETAQLASAVDQAPKS